MNEVVSLVPSLSNLGAYTRYVNSLPMLTEEREHELAGQLKLNGSLDAAKELILSHLRFVVKIAKEHSGYGLPQEDLIQEGNVGLMLAVKKFDASFGVRLSSYAAIWIRSEIQEYILSNWRMVKIGASKGLRKLFFNLRKIQLSLHGESDLDKKEKVAQLLGVSNDEVERAIEWFSGGDVALLDQSADEPIDSSSSTVFLLPGPVEMEPERAVEDLERTGKLPRAIDAAMSLLTDRERDVVYARYYSDPQKTLSTISRELSVSIERVRQIEVAALKKMKASSNLDGFRG